MRFLIGFLSLTFILTPRISAQCDGKTGFALQLCQAQATGSAAGVPGTSALDPRASALTTSYADAIRLDTLPPSIDPKGFRPLTSLDRADDGSFILKPGIYEAFVQSYALDAGDNNAQRAGGYFPAPIKGNKAKIIAAVLKDIELHPDVSQGDVQALLLAVASGTDLEKMPAAVQQTAARVLPRDVLSQMQSSSQAKTAESKILGYLDRRMARNKSAQQTLSQVDNTEANVQQNAQAFSAPRVFKDAAAGAAAIARGTWAQMPGGFYVRYLPEGYSKTRVQVIVTDEAIAQAGSNPILFDPTQYLAVLCLAPSERIGISLRPVAAKK